MDHLLPDARVTWCATLGQYASDTCSDRHDHHDVAVTERGRLLFRYWPVGTVLADPDGAIYRITRYDLSLAGENSDRADVPEVPHYDLLRANGSAAALGWDVAPDPRTLTVIQHVAPDDIAVGSLFVRPCNGETWRLVAKPLSELVEATWDISTQGGTGRRLGSLPEDARLIWVP